MIPRFHVPAADAAASTVVLPDDEAHHLRHVLRLSAGRVLRVFDGRGREWEGFVEAVDKQGVRVVLEREIEPVAEPPAAITLALAVLKSDYMDAAIRDAAMIGAAAVQPIVASRSTFAPPTGDAVRLVSRWQRIVVASIKQCGRAVVPPVMPPCSFDAWIRKDGPAGPAVRILLAEPSVPADRPPPDFGDWLARARTGGGAVLVGPEGGWTLEEAARAERAGYAPWTISPRVLRADVAGAIALSVLFYAWEKAAEEV
jgi:16S rRNA (uracil1498-N3)-methyltransferase